MPRLPATIVLHAFPSAACEPRHVWFNRDCRSSGARYWLVTGSPAALIGAAKVSQPQRACIQELAGDVFHPGRWAGGYEGRGGESGPSHPARVRVWKQRNVLVRSGSRREQRGLLLWSFRYGLPGHRSLPGHSCSNDLVAVFAQFLHQRTSGSGPGTRQQRISEYTAQYPSGSRSDSAAMPIARRRPKQRADCAANYGGSF